MTEVSKRSELIGMLEECGSAIVVLDYHLFDIANIDDLLHLGKRFPLVSWVLFSAELAEQTVVRLSAEQNFSIVLKDDSAHEIASAMRCAVGGTRFLCRHATDILLAAKDSKLTATEIEILKQIALGKSAKEIAAERYSSIHTIRTHKKNIFRKIDVNTTYEAMRYAMRAGIIEMVEYYI